MEHKLMTMVHNRDFEGFKTTILLHSKDININWKSKQYRDKGFLHQMCQRTKRDDFDFIEFMISPEVQALKFKYGKHINWNLRDGANLTPLHRAKGFNLLGLLTKGECKYDVFDKHGFIPLVYALFDNVTRVTPDIPDFPLISYNTALLLSGGERTPAPIYERSVLAKCIKNVARSRNVSDRRDKVKGYLEKIMKNPIRIRAQMRKEFDFHIGDAIRLYSFVLLTHYEILEIIK